MGKWKILYMNINKGIMTGLNHELSKVSCSDGVLQIWWKLLFRENNAFQKEQKQDVAGTDTTASSWAKGFPLLFKVEIIAFLKDFKSNS